MQLELGFWLGLQIFGSTLEENASGEVQPLYSLGLDKGGL